MMRGFKRQASEVWVCAPFVLLFLMENEGVKRGQKFISVSLRLGGNPLLRGTGNATVSGIKKVSKGRVGLWEC